MFEHARGFGEFHDDHDCRVPTYSNDHILAALNAGLTLCQREATERGFADLVISFSFMQNAFEMKIYIFEMSILCTLPDIVQSTCPCVYVPGDTETREGPVFSTAKFA